MIKHMLIQAHSTTFLFICLPIWMKTPLLLLLVRSKVSGKSRITQMIRVQVSWTKIYLYISLLMLHNCQTSGRWFPTKTVHLPLKTEGNVRGMHRLLSWLSNCRTTFHLISVQHKQQTKKSIFPDSTSSENQTQFYPLPSTYFFPKATAVFSYFDDILHNVTLHNKILSCHIL